MDSYSAKILTDGVELNNAQKWRPWCQLEKAKCLSQLERRRQCRFWRSQQNLEEGEEGKPCG